MLRPSTETSTDQAARDKLLHDIGWDVGALIGFDSTDLQNALAASKTAVDTVVTKLDGGLEDLGEVLICVNAIREATTAMATLVEGWRPGPAPDPTLPAPPDPGADPYLLFLSDIFNFLLDSYLTRRLPNLKVALDILGVHQLTEVSAPVLIGGRQARDARSRPVYTIQPLVDLLTDPVAVIRARVFEDQNGISDRAADLLADEIGPLLVQWLTSLGLSA